MTLHNSIKQHKEGPIDPISGGSGVASGSGMSTGSGV